MIIHYQVVRYLNDPESCKIVEYKNTFDDLDSARSFANNNNVSGFTIVPEKVDERQELIEHKLLVYERNERLIAIFFFAVGCIEYAYLLFFWSHS